MKSKVMLPVIKVKHISLASYRALLALGYTVIIVAAIRS